MVTVDETKTVDALWIARRVAMEELETHGGWLFGLPGDGLFALFESTVEAVRCALRVQGRLAELPKLHALKLRIGVHLGEVLFKDEHPCGEALVIASRLESLAEPGGILVSASVMNAVGSRIAATFIESGVPTLKHSPRRIETFRVVPPPPPSGPGRDELLDRTIASRPSAPDLAPRHGFVDPSVVARLPKARPLVVPSRTSATVVSPPSELHGKARSREGSAADLDDASLGRLAMVLTHHLGPVAKVLVRRKAAVSRDAAQLIRSLAQEIPGEGERRSFLMRARIELARLH